MRPHLLRMTAFGPFPGTVEVDLDRLSAGGLFLLHGETGAGKTTLLDGIGFALYGRVPGLRGRAARLRSDLAPAGVRTEVTLEVTLGGRRWRITRSPAQERAKSRGTGTTTEQARVRLEEQRDGSWETVSTRIDEAAAELDPLLGMSADQFFQVVLLPQGEFARFLRAESKERAQLLQRLFATERFQAVEDWLAARRVATAAAVTAAREQLQVLAARLDQAAGPVGLPPLAAPPDPSAPDEQPVEAGPAWWQPRLAACAADAVRAGEAAERARADRDGARRHLEAVADLAGRQDRRVVALEARGALVLADSACAALREELAAATRAAEIGPLLDEAEARAQHAVTASRDETLARAALPAVGLAADLPEPGLQAALAEARAASARLAALRPVADDLAGEQRAVDVAGQEAASESAVRARCEAVLAALPARRVASAAALAEARAAAAQLPQVRARRAELLAALHEARGLAGVQERLAGLRDEHLLARETAVSLREKESELRDARLTSMVAELASILQPGVPCEVCGSRDHPDPYEGWGSGATREDEERARAEADEAGRRVSSVAAQIAASEALAQAHLERLAALDEPVEAVAVQGRLVLVEEEHEHLAALADQEPAAVAAVQALEAEQASAQDELVRATSRLEAAQRRGEESAARADRLGERLRAELGAAADLDAALALVERRAATCEAVLRAAQDGERARAEQVRSAAAAEQAAAATGTTSEQARRARRDPRWRQETAQRCREHDDRWAAVRAALEDPELDVPVEPRADVSAGRAAVDAADAALSAAVAARSAAERRAAEVADLVPRLDLAWAELQPLADTATRVRRLADLCAGGGANALRMTLTSFVLAARLEEVAERASARLLRMTQGRYTLIHTDGAARGGVRSGLGLLVRDGWTGRDRETSTLSGGETFQASLALALGLADAVQEESGGTRIEALFVDEGFGTLDEETLEEVLDVLDGLREGGRMVGLVSHVAELKARIPAQVRVRKAPQGSTVTVSGC